MPTTIAKLRAPLHRRVPAALQRRAEMLRHRGDAVACPLCGHAFDRFKDDWNRQNAICWRCGAHERQRALWLYLERHPKLLSRAGELLHFAPEWCLERRLRAVPGLRYQTADLDPRLGELQLDITDIALPDGSVGAILCSHVLEHIEDDRAAIAELARVLKPGGWLLVMVPLDVEREETWEDPTIVEPAERERAFWQYDHVRLYAPDLAERLRAPGLEVERVRWTRELGAALAARHRLLDADDVFHCVRPAAAAGG
jgi:SAM-dependent methyltransferase